MDNTQIWGPRALAKFEGLARAQRNGQPGIGQDLLHARESDRPKDIRRAFNHMTVRKNTPAQVQDKLHLSSEARELLERSSN